MSHYQTAYSAVLVVIWLSALAGFRTRSPKYIGAGIEEYRRVVAASFWTFGAVAMAELLFKLELSRGYLAVALPVGTLVLGPQSVEVARITSCASARPAAIRPRCWRSATATRSRISRAN